MEIGQVEERLVGGYQDRAEEYNLDEKGVGNAGSRSFS